MHGRRFPVKEMLGREAGMDGSPGGVLRGSRSAAAAPAPPITVPPLTAVDVAEMTAKANFPHEGYRLEPGDAIQIRYIHHPEMAQDDVIPPDAKINAKLVGEVEVAGLTTDQLEELLAKRSSDSPQGTRRWW